MDDIYGLLLPPPPQAVVDKAFSLPPPIHGLWAVTGQLSPRWVLSCPSIDRRVEDWDWDCDPWIDWDAVRALPDGTYLISAWSDSSGFSPRFYGEEQQFLAVRGGDNRLLNVRRSGGARATWGFRSPYEASRTAEDVWEVLDTYPYLPSGVSADRGLVPAGG